MKSYSEKYLDNVIWALVRGVNIAFQQEEIEAANKSATKAPEPWKKVRKYFRVAINNIMASYKAKDRAKVRAKAKSARARAAKVKV